jgi:hypothetical protein
LNFSFFLNDCSSCMNVSSTSGEKSVC